MFDAHLSFVKVEGKITRKRNRAGVIIILSRSGCIPARSVCGSKKTPGNFLAGRPLFVVKSSSRSAAAPRALLSIVSGAQM
jgi:hypothetical protein